MKPLKTLLFALLLGVIATGASAKPNILFITVDDMSCDSIGVFGCQLEGTSPNVDQLAAEGMRFEYAHVQVGNCYPSRNVMFSGRFPHNSGVEGFYQVKPIDFPVMCDLMKAAGYFVGIRGKVSHSTPYQPYAWDLVMDSPNGEKAHIKDVPSYGASTKMGIAAAKTAGKPFCLNINISDPHKPFWKPNDPHPASRVYTADEVPIPGFLFDDPQVREELALYYTSVRRADDAVGSILKALEDSGEADNTVVMFLSDHGMPLPFAKTQLWHHSTRTPWIVKWPGVIEPGTVDKKHMISAVDLTPTFLDIAGAEHPEGFDGKSFYPLLKGKSQDGRDWVIKEYAENAGGNRHPMRGVETKSYLYLFNPWSDGENVFRTATQGTVTYRRMKQLAPTDEAFAARLELFDHRVVEELYDVKIDPDCLHNLIDDQAHGEALSDLRDILEKWMVETGDPALEAFRGREDKAVLAAFMEKQQAQSAERKKARQQKKKAAQRVKQESQKKRKNQKGKGASQ